MDFKSENPENKNGENVFFMETNFPFFFASFRYTRSQFASHIALFT